MSHSSNHRHSTLEQQNSGSGVSTQGAHHDLHAPVSMSSVPFSFMENMRTGSHNSSTQHHNAVNHSMGLPHGSYHTGHSSNHHHHHHHSSHHHSSTTASSSTAAHQLVDYQMYKSSSHSTGLLAGLNQCRLENQLCDVTLLAADKQFKAHRIVLASCSTFFKELFNTAKYMKPTNSQTSNSQVDETTSCSEKDSDISDATLLEKPEVVEVRGVSPEGLKLILNFIYTSELPLSIHNIREVLAAGQHMNLKPVISFCKTFLCKEISVWNCVHLIHIAEQFGLQVVEEHCYEFIAQHLNELVKTEEIHKLSFDNMALLLDSNGLRNVTELELFEAARQWLSFEEQRYQHIRTLMEKIRFPQIPPRDLLRFVNFVDFMRIECNYLLLEASNYHMLPHSQPILQSIRTQVRSNDLRIVVVGGVDEQDTVSNQIIATNIERSDYLPALYDGLCSHCVVTLNNYLYVLGGQSVFDERGGTAVSTVVRYDPRFNIWMKIASMNEKRAGFSCSVLDGSKIYALGGVNATGRLSSMECYSLEEDRWRYVASLRTGICDHASDSHGNLLYVTGGFKEERFSNCLYAYSPRHDTWHERAPMHVPRGWHCMVTVADNIFVTGGNAGLNKRVDVHDTEMYRKIENYTKIFIFKLSKFMLSIFSSFHPQQPMDCCFKPTITSIRSWLRSLSKQNLRFGRLLLGTSKMCQHNSSLRSGKRSVGTTRKFTD